jgi:hypothetical protein
MHIYVDEKLRYAGCVDTEYAPRRVARPRGIDSQEDAPTNGAARRIDRRRRTSFAVMHHRVAALEMPEWMQDPISDHPQRLMMFVQPPLRTRVRDHSLHDVLLGDGIDENGSGYLLEAGLYFRKLK